MSDLEKKSPTVDADVELKSVAHEDGVTAVYEAKSRLINEHMQKDIGWGAYQWQLFILTGLGWAADNFWLQGVAIILPQIQKELNPTRVEYATLSLYVGLILGASVWGVLCDLIGRRLSFNITLFIAGVFGISAGAASDFTTIAALIACMGFGIGGNLPVDGAVFLEQIPQSHQWCLTLLSAWWALGQLFASLIAWPLIANFSCESADVCTKENNMGWRYTFYTLGGVTLLMWVARFVVFDLQESSKYLVAKGRDREAIQSLKHIAKKNGRTVTLSVESLQSIGDDKSLWWTNSFSSFSLSHVRPLFSTKRLAVNTSIIILIWGMIGLAYPLFNGFITLYLSTQVTDGDPSTDRTYRDYAIISTMGIPGSILACFVVDWTRKSAAGTKHRFPMGGRKITMAVSTALTGIFLFLFTSSHKSVQVLAFSCASGITQNAMYGVLYAYTPEVFPAPHRGTGDALCSAFNRITGILAPVIKIATTNSDGTASSSGLANGPIFVSASLFMISSVFMLLLPIEVPTNIL
ncbi:MFS general substrate transporter [Flagelloscypha sp. PMI_526]|nr:MFS general substrate transporter [Flagelloscypha sp. PMI_526]